MTVAEIQTLIAGIEADFLEEQVWRQWSERTLLDVSPVPVWLVELYDAENTNDALAALYRGWNKANGDDAPLNQTELYLGFLYLRYLAGNLTLQIGLTHLNFENLQQIAFIPTGFQPFAFESHFATLFLLEQV